MSVAPDVYQRQNKFYHPARMNRPVSVVGCGSLGSYIAVSLAKLGLTDFTLWDDDLVELHNIPNQAFDFTDCGAYKAVVLAELLSQNLPIDVHKSIVPMTELWSPGTPLKDGVIINAADSIVVRKMVAEEAPKSAFIIDVRSGEDSFNVFFCYKGNKYEWNYYTNFFFDPENSAGNDCNRQSTVYNSMVIAAIAVKGYVEFARGQEYPRSVDGVWDDFSIAPVYSPKSQKGKVA